MASWRKIPSINVFKLFLRNYFWAIFECSITLNARSLCMEDTNSVPRIVFNAQFNLQLIQMIISFESHLSNERPRRMIMKHI